jgi:adenosylcobinamide-GDP ribazoletransferase
MNMLVRELRLFLLALQFLTRVPVPAWVGFDDALMRRAVRHFPLVGALVGTFGAGIALAAGRLWPPTVAAALGVAGTVWLTAALHEDGLADTFDALLGAASREKALVIMKDSRIGTYGAVALGLSLLLRVLLLAESMAHGPWACMSAWIASHAAGRSVAVMLMYTLPYAGDEGRAKTRALNRDVRASDVAWAAAVGLLAVTIAASRQSMPAFVVTACCLSMLTLFVLMRAWLGHRLGGHTGDTLGATEQLGEIGLLLAITARVT